MLSFFNKSNFLKKSIITDGLLNNIVICTSNNSKRGISTTTESSKLLEYKRTRDQVINAHNEKFRISIINLTKSANISKSKHNLSTSDAQLLGKLMSGVSMCASFLSDEERISAQIISDINPTHIYAEAIQVGEVRGFLINGDSPRLETPNEIIKRKGIFQFSKILYSYPRPIQSVVAVEDKDLTITKEFQHYFDQSEQIPTFIQLESKINVNINNNQDNDSNSDIIVGSTKTSSETVPQSLEFNGGILIQTLPSTSNEDLNNFKKNIENYSLANLFVNEKKSMKDILSILTNNDPTIEIISTTFVDFYCRCTLKTFKDKIMTLGINEVKHLEEHNHNELKCIYCNKYHYLKDTDFKEMINHLEVEKDEKLKVIKEMEMEMEEEQQKEKEQEHTPKEKGDK